MDYQNLIQERLAAIPPLLREFVRSSEPTVIAETFASTYQFDESRLIALENGVVLFLIGLFDKSALTEFLTLECRIPAPDAPLVVSAIEQALPADIQIIVSSLSTKDLSLESEIAVAEAMLRSVPSTQVQPATEPTYTSTQSAILNEGSKGGQWETR